VALRIVGGTAGGRKLVAPEKGTRPTSERAREALFNTLGGLVHLDGARFLDLYAGTGAVGLEALSRGAGPVVLVESRRQAVEVIRRNVEAVGLPDAEVVHAPANRYLSTPDLEPFDVIFADPPYDVKDVNGLLVLMTAVAHADTVLVIERRHGSHGPQWSALGLHALRERRYGDSVLWYGRAR